MARTTQRRTRFVAPGTVIFRREVVDNLAPKSFRQFPGVTGATRKVTLVHLYFSFTTLSTVGYGVGGSGCQALSRAQGSIGVPPVFSIRVQDDDQKLAGPTLPRSHEPICSRHSAAQARRLCYHRLGVMPPLTKAKLQRHFVPGYDRTVPRGHFATGFN